MRKQQKKAKRNVKRNEERKRIASYKFGNVKVTRTKGHNPFNNVYANITSKRNGKDGTELELRIDADYLCLDGYDARSLFRLLKAHYDHR